jgi:hypothetical protein
MGSLSRRAALRCSAVVLAVAVVVPVASGIAAATDAGAVPPKLVGVWSRNLTQANLNKYGLSRAFHPVGVWTIVVKNRGDVDVYTPGKYRAGCKACYPTFPIFFSATGARVTIGPDPECSGTRGVYGWEVSGRALTLKLIADKTCGPREALFPGVWKRK